jgi:hypothetical protein
LVHIHFFRYRTVRHAKLSLQSEPQLDSRDWTPVARFSQLELKANESRK